MDAEAIPDLLRESPQFGRSKLLPFQKLETFSQQRRFDGDRAQPAKHSIYLAPEEKSHASVEYDQGRYPDCNIGP